VHRRIREAGGFATVYEWVATGETMAAIAQVLGCSTTLLREILTQTDERRALFDNARRESASAHAERGLEIIDEPLPLLASNADVQHRKERANYRRWLASKLDKETFGDTPLVQVNSNPTLIFAQQYLQALKSPVPSGPSLPVKEAEIVEVTDGIPEARQIEDHSARVSDQVERVADGAVVASATEVVQVQGL
jgi:hypothetical protein